MVNNTVLLFWKKYCYMNEISQWVSIISICIINHCFINLTLQQQRTASRIWRWQIGPTEYIAKTWKYHANLFVTLSIPQANAIWKSMSNIIYSKWEKMTKSKKSHANQMWLWAKNHDFSRMLLHTIALGELLLSYMKLRKIIENQD